MPAVRKVIDADGVCKRYLAGESEKALAHGLGVSRNVIVRRLVKANIERRSPADAIRLAYSRTTPEFRQMVTKPAHDAARGRKCSFEEMSKRAATREARPVLNCAEKSICEALSEWFEVAPQKAFGKYNVDVAIKKPAVAVEIFGGGWHNSGHHKARFIDRSRYLLNSGVSLLIIWVDARRFPLTRCAAHEARAFADFVSGNPSAVGHYRVISGNGQVLAELSNHFNDRATIEALGIGHRAPLPMDAGSR